MCSSKLFAYSYFKCLKWHSFMFQMLFCSNLAHFTGIQHICVGRTDGWTDRPTENASKKLIHDNVNLAAIPHGCMSTYLPRLNHFHPRQLTFRTFSTAYRQLPSSPHTYLWEIRSEAFEPHLVLRGRA